MVKTRRFRGGKKSKRHTHHKHHSTHRRKVKRYNRRGTKRRRRKRTKRLKRGGTRKNVMKGGAGANSLYLYIDKDEVKNYGYAKKAFMRIASASSQDIQWKTPDKPRQDVPITESINKSAKKNVQNFIQYVLIQADLEKERLMTVVAKNIIDSITVASMQRDLYILKLKDFIKNHPKTLNIINTGNNLVEAAAAEARRRAAEEEGRQAKAEARRRAAEEEGRQAMAAAEERRRRAEAGLSSDEYQDAVAARAKLAEAAAEAAAEAGLSSDEYQDAVAAAAEAGLSPDDYLKKAAAAAEEEKEKEGRERVDKLNKFTQLIINKEQINPPDIVTDEGNKDLVVRDTDISMVIEQLKRPPFNYLLENIPPSKNIVEQKLKDIPLANTDSTLAALAIREGTSKEELEQKFKTESDTSKKNATRDINLLKLQVLRRILLIKAGMKLDDIKKEENANSNWWDYEESEHEESEHEKSEHEESEHEESEHEKSEHEKSKKINWIKKTINNVVKNLFFNKGNKHAYPDDADLYRRVEIMLVEWVPPLPTSEKKSILEDSGINVTRNTGIAVTDREVNQAMEEEEKRKAAAAAEAAMKAATAQRLSESQAHAAAEAAHSATMSRLREEDVAVPQPPSPHSPPPPLSESDSDDD